MCLFEDVKTGLEQAIAYEKGTCKANKTTLAAVEEVRRMKADPSIGTAYRDVDEMMKDLLP